MQKLPKKISGRPWNLARKRQAFEVIQLAKRRRKRATTPPPPEPIVLTLLDGLVAYWKLEEGSDEMRLDSSGNSLDLTDNNTVDQAASMIGNGANFAYADHDRWLDHPDDPFLRFDADFTMSLWVYQFEPVFSSDTMINSTGGVYLVTFGHALELVMYDADGNLIVDIPGNADVTPEQWHHLVFFRSGNTVGLIIDNGEPAIQTEISAFPRVGEMFRIGAHESGYPFTGTIDEVGKWNRVLSATEISTLYNGGAGLPLEDF